MVISKVKIVDSLSSIYFCGGDCVEDVTSHQMPHLSLHPTLCTCSSDTILRGISELATINTTYTSDTGKSYDFNMATKLNIPTIVLLTMHTIEEVLLILGNLCFIKFVQYKIGAIFFHT